MISPSQYSGFLVLGVPPPTIVAISPSLRCSQAFWLLKQCRWRLQNVQKWQSQIVQLWHEKTALKVAEGMHKQYNGNMMSKPQVVVKATVKAVNARRPKPRYLIGFGAKPLVFAHAILPTRVFDFIMMHAS